MAVVDQVLKAAKPFATVAVSAAALVIKKGSEIIIEKIEEEKLKIPVPAIISPEGYMQVDEAKKQFESLGFKVSVSVANPKANFKDRSESDVVSINPNHKRLLPGIPIVLYYVTAEVIEKSKQLFEDAEKKREAAEQKKAEQLAAVKEKVSNAAVHIQEGASNAVDFAKETAGKLKKQKKSTDDFDYEVVTIVDDYTDATDEASNEN